MTGQELKAIIEKLGMTQGEFAQVVGVSQRSVQRYVKAEKVRWVVAGAAEWALADPKAAWRIVRAVREGKAPRLASMGV